jgi:hypothetical protein
MVEPAPAHLAVALPSRSRVRCAERRRDHLAAGRRKQHFGVLVTIFPDDSAGEAAWDRRQHPVTARNR